MTEYAFVNAAQALNRGVSGSDALRATTICIAQTEDGSVFVASATTPDATDDTDRQAAAQAVADALIAAPVLATKRRGAKAPAPTPDPAPETAPDAVEEAPAT